jgi:predicted glycosyltransferase
MAADGWETLLICGGTVPADFVFPTSVDIELLEPIQSDPEYKSLQPGAAGADLDGVKARRAARLLAIFESFRPDALITEMYPFGRKQFAYELLPLLLQAKAAQRKPLIVCSVRDILVKKRDRETFEQGVLGAVNSLYDLVLVHSDEAIQPLHATFSLANEIQVPVIHTGYVIAPTSAATAVSDSYLYESLIPFLHRDEPFILVSCGSGRLQAGQQLIRAAIAAAPELAKDCKYNMLVCAGPLARRDTFIDYQWMAVGRTNVHLVHDLPHLQQLLPRASLSVSLGGYNTVMELLAARTQGLVYAAEPNGDDEQKVRIVNMAKRGILREIEPADLLNGGLAKLIAASLARPLKSLSIEMDGATTSAKAISEFLSLKQKRTYPLAEAAHLFPSRNHLSQPLEGESARHSKCA